MAAAASTAGTGGPDTASHPSTATPVSAPTHYPSTAAGPVPLPPTLAGQRSDTAAGVGAAPAIAPANVPASDAPHSNATAAAPQPPATAAAPAAAAATAAAPSTGPYTRNYIILSKVPGGLAGEMRLILGDHVDWDRVQYVPTRARPLSESLILTSTSPLGAWLERYWACDICLGGRRVRTSTCMRRSTEMSQGDCFWLQPAAHILFTTIVAYCA